MRVIVSLLILFLIAVMIAFAYYNGPDQTVDVNLIWMERFDVPVITVVFWAFILGAAISWLLSITVYIKQYNQLRQARKSMKGLQNEVTSLRNRPIEETKNLLDKTDDSRE